MMNQSTAGAATASQTGPISDRTQVRQRYTFEGFTAGPTWAARLMIRPMKHTLLSLLALALFAATDYETEGRRWWSHIQTLADDNMQGRNTGSEGHRKAAAYVAGEFERAGLKPAGTSGYMQPVKFDVVEINEGQSSVALVRDGKAEALKLGEDAIVSL